MICRDRYIHVHHDRLTLDLANEVTTGNHSSSTWVYLCLWWLSPNVHFYKVQELMWVSHLPERAQIHLWSLLTVLNPDYVLAFPKWANLQCERVDSSPSLTRQSSDTSQMSLTVPNPDNVLAFPQWVILWCAWGDVLNKIAKAIISWHIWYSHYIFI